MKLKVEDSEFEVNRRTGEIKKVILYCEICKTKLTKKNTIQRLDGKLYCSYKCLLKENEENVL